MIKKFLNIQTKSIGRASILLAVFYVSSALLGLWRDHLLASRVGTQSLDIYYAAFTIPDLIGLLMIFGAISAAIIPVFTTYLQKSENEAWEYTNNLLNVFLFFLILVCAIFILLSPWLVKIIAPGFSLEKQATTATLMRLMFLSPIILGISNIISGILQVFHRFLVTALAPVMYNVGIILGIFFFLPAFGLKGLALGVLLGGMFHLIIQLPVFFHLGYRWQAMFHFWHPGVLKTLKLTIPRSLGLGAGQINTIITTVIASTLTAGSIGIFTLANNLSNMVVSMLGVSLSTAVFPSLTKIWATEDKNKFAQQFSQSLLWLLFFIVPVSVILFFLRAQVVRVVLGSGRFGWADTRLTAACLGLFAIGICFQALIIFLSKTFYAVHNTKIPALASIITVVVNILLSFYFVWAINSHGVFHNFLQYWLKLQGIENIGVLGLALSFSVTGIAEALLLLYLLHTKYQVFIMRFNVVRFWSRRQVLENDSNIFPSILKIMISAWVLMLVLVFVRQLLVDFNITNTQSTLGVFLQLVFSSILGLVGYLVALYCLNFEFFNKK